jgi:hypothetical protein
MDAVLALLGSLLTPIPGPNVFFLYPAARALSHYFARAGVRKVRHPGVLSFETEPIIDSILRHWDDFDAAAQDIQHLEKQYGFYRLHRLLEKL